MTQEEQAILQVMDNALPIESAKQYSDEFYETYTERFQPSKKKKIFYRFVKRTFDICSSLLALIVLLIPFAVIAVAIRCESKGPAVFKNRRVGKNGKIFYCLKFRTMTVSAPSEVATSAGTTDGYITKVGRFLRRTSIDELPQLWNVLIGQMTIIGYRPLVPTEEKCNAMRERLGVFAVKPGISGYAQVHGRDSVYYKNKALMDAFYVKNATLGMDVSLLFNSIKVVLSRKNNHDESQSQPTGDTK